MPASYFYVWRRGAPPILMQAEHAHRNFNAYAR
jgi:hypothetical protein